MKALHDVVQVGYVRYIGMSSCYAWQCEQPYHVWEPVIDYSIVISFRNAKYVITISLNLLTHINCRLRHQQ